MTFDYSGFVKQIKVTHGQDGVPLYDGFKSMYNCLSQCGKTFTGMPFSRKVWLAAEVLNEIKQNNPKPKPDTLVTAGRLFIYTFGETGLSDEYRVTVTDTKDNSIILDEYLEILKTAGIMDGVHDINGLYTFLVGSGELLPSDELVMTNDRDLDNELKS